MRSAATDRGISPGRTSRPALPTTGPRLSRSTCSGRRRHRPCRPSHGSPLASRTTDANDKAVLGKRSRGRSQTLLYNEERPHGAIGQKTPIMLLKPATDARKLYQPAIRSDRAGKLYPPAVQSSASVQGSSLSTYRWSENPGAVQSGALRIYRRWHRIAPARPRGYSSAEGRKNFEPMMRTGHQLDTFGTRPANLLKSLALPRELEPLFSP